MGTPTNVRERTARRWRRLGVAAASVAAIAVPIGMASAAPVEVTGGTISWGVKESFRSYVTGPIAHGSITLDAGALESGGVYQFPVSSGSRDAAATTADARSGGSVRFAGHDGVLEVQISNIEVSVSGTAGSIVADVDYRPFTDTVTQNPLQSAPDVVLASLNLAGITPADGAGTVSFSNVPATLTAAGATAFGGFYPAGTALDPISFTLALGGGGGPGPDPDPDVPGLTGGALRWVMSEQLWGQTSINQCRVTVDPASIVAGDWNSPDSGVVFPASTGTYDATNGAGSLALDGAVVLGNYAQGNYRLRLSGLAVTIGADGAGTLTADVEYSLGAGAPPTDCSGDRTWTNAGDDLTIVRFSADPATRTMNGDSVYWTVTPPWATADPAYSFDASFVDALPASLQGHFRATGNPVDPNSTANLRKPPAPMYLRFDLAPTGQTGTISIITELVTEGALTISVADTTVQMTPLALSSSGVRYQASGQLSQVTVTDTRATNPGWNLSVQMTDFAGAAGTFPGTGLGWTPTVVSASDGQMVTPGAAVAPGVGLSGKTLASADAGAGRGTAVVGAGLVLHAPTSIEAGTYTATMTVTTI